MATSSPGLEAEFGVRNFWINDLLTGGRMLFSGFGVLCVRLVPSLRTQTVRPMR